MAILKTANTKDKYFDNDSKKNVINYIVNEDKTPNNFIGSRGFKTDNYAEEMNNVSKKFNKTEGVQLRHFIVSFTPWEVCDPAVAYRIGNEICDYLGNEYQTVFAVHENTQELHLHIASNSVSYIDGHRYKGTRKEFYAMKNQINNILENYDIKPVKYISNKK